MRVARYSWSALPALVLAGCATHRAPPAVADVPPPVEVAAGPALPPGATPGMLVPQPLADGSFPTPNRGLTGAAAIWHLRAGLNVAALSCQGVEGAAIRAGYNGWLKRDKAPLARAQASYAGGYRVQPVATGGYDEAMTRLYNFFSQTPVRPAFCTAAASIVGEMATPGAGALPAFAEARLAVLDQPFTDFYRAYAAWRDGTAPRPVTAATVIAATAITPPAPLAAALAPPMPVTVAAIVARPAVAPAGRPTLTLDLSALPADTTVAGR